MSPSFTPAWWLPDAHLQTIFAAKLRRTPNIHLTRERVELPDGDFLDLDWAEEQPGPIVLLLHGLEGSSDSAYAAGMMKALHHHGFQAVLMHFRGCSGTPNRLQRSYHAGETGDMALITHRIKESFPKRKIAAIGFSLGGNALLKWLGEPAEHSPLDAACAISVPFKLERAADRLRRGVSRLYQGYLLNQLKHRYKQNQHVKLNVKHCKDFYCFDDSVTAPIHGFRDVHNYYHQCSSIRYLGNINRPTLIIHSLDDPFMYPDVIPDPSTLNSCVELDITKRGGHVGFVSGSLPWKPDYWLESRVPQWLHSKLNP